MKLQYDKNGGLLRAFSFARLMRGFAKLKKIIKSEKMLKWVCESSAKLRFFFFEILCLLCCFHVSKNKKN